MKNNRSEDICIVLKGVSASKLKANCRIVIINSNPVEKKVLYRIFGLRNDGFKHDLLASETILLGPSDSEFSIREVGIGYDSIIEFNETYYTVIVDLIFPKAVKV